MTLPKQLLYAACDVMCDQVICRLFRTLVCKNLRVNFKIHRELDCSLRDCKFSVEISRRLYKIVKSSGPLDHIIL